MTTPQSPQGQPGTFGPADNFGQPAPGYAPPAGQVPGQYPGQVPGQAPAYVPPGAQVPGGYGQPPVVKPKGGRGKKIVIGIVTVIMVIVVKLVIGFAIGYATADKPVHAKAGECVHVTGGNTNPKVDTVDCGSADADYTVVSVIDNSFDLHA
ncbi:hypothetical protein, partial [Kitasatospora sp. NPDC059571]|uniref:LppU/SCO3897 family protein n=1 Tax=Kitasatospora sp. NPDC059571 TaxID=3346871 RepID=UPI00367A43EC